MFTLVNLSFCHAWLIHVTVEQIQSRVCMSPCSMQTAAELLLFFCVLFFCSWGVYKAIFWPHFGFVFGLVQSPWFKTHVCAGCCVAPLDRPARARLGPRYFGPMESLTDNENNSPGSAAKWCISSLLEPDRARLHWLIGFFWLFPMLYAIHP